MEAFRDIIQNGVNDVNADIVSDLLQDISDNYDFSDKCYNYILLLFISYIEVQCNFVPIVALKLKELKAHLLVVDIGNLPIVKDVFKNTLFIDDTLTTEILQEKDGAIIYKQYLPSGNEFTLPPYGKTGTLKVKFPDESGTVYEGVVEIDSRGIVQNILKDMEPVDIPRVDGDNIYSELLSKIMEFDPEFNKADDDK